MIKVDQQLSCSDTGDCMRAVIASLLELEMEQVPNFILFDAKAPRLNSKSPKHWTRVFRSFLESCGYTWESHGHFESGDPVFEESIEGYFYAVVNSRNFKDTTHAVVMDMNGIVAHDPAPDKKWQGEDLRNNEDFKYWLTFEYIG